MLMVYKIATSYIVVANEPLHNNFATAVQVITKIC